MNPWYLGIGAGVLVLLLGTRRVVSADVIKRYPTTYDEVFRVECPGIPVEYLRSLARHESDMNPDETTGGAWGLLQVWWMSPGSVLDDYNKRKGTTYSREDLLDPATNARLACETLHRIATYYERNFRRVFPNPSWRDRRFVEIVTLGWNAGWAQRSGVAYVMSNLVAEGRGADIDLAMIRDAAGRYEQATDKLRSPTPYWWARKVVTGYFAQRGDV